MVYNKILVALGPFTKVTGPTVSYQYDQKQILVISGVTLPEYYEVDICNEGDATTVTMVGTADGVLIPNAFLRTGRKVKAYVVLQGQDPGAVETRYEITLPVYVRPAREDIDPTAAEQQQIDELVAALNDGVSRAETAAEAAEQAETGIEAYVERAETAADNAETSESNAAASETNAANSASIAATKANQAASSAQSASQDASAANASAGSAAQSASSASLSASAAAGSASNAASSANSASASAGQAVSSAQSASGSASQAAGSAQSASGSATAASQSATNAANSASEATTQAGNAATKAGEAASSATAAGNAQSAAETAQGKAEDAQEAAEEAQAAAEAAVASIQYGGMNIVSLSGTAITQTGADNTFYICGELSELTFTAQANTSTAIRFTSGATPTVLTMNGVDKWMFDFDPDNLEANVTYEISVVYGVGVAGWA